MFETMNFEKLAIAERIEVTLINTVKKSGNVKAEVIRNRIAQYKNKFTEQEQEEIFVALFTLYGKN